jgi:hypothetical protein
MEENTQCINEAECPYCAEKISDRAKKCKHCGEFLDTAMRDVNSLKSQRQNTSISNSSSSSACAAYGATQTILVDIKENVSSKSRTTALLLVYFLGPLGQHRYYVGKDESGKMIRLLSACTFASFVVSIFLGIENPLSVALFSLSWVCVWVLIIWLMIDSIRILGGEFTDNEGKVLKRW